MRRLRAGLPSLPANGSGPIMNSTRESRVTNEEWIASSLSRLAMTRNKFAGPANYLRKFADGGFVEVKACGTK